MGIDRRTVYTRTSKGHKELAGRTSFLKQYERSVLFSINGKDALGEIEGRIDAHIAKRLEPAIKVLLRDGFICIPEPHELSAEALSGSTALMVAGSTRTATKPPVHRAGADHTSPDPSLEDTASDDVVNEVLKRAQTAARRTGMVDRLHKVEAAARKRAAAETAREGQVMVAPAKRLQAAFGPKAAPGAPTSAAASESLPPLDPKRVLARTGKGALEIIGRTCSLSPTLQKLLLRFDGEATIAEIQQRAGAGAPTADIHALLQDGYLHDSAMVCDGLEPEIGFDAEVSGGMVVEPRETPTDRLAAVDLERIAAERAAVLDVWRELAEAQRREAAAADAAREQARAPASHPDDAEAGRVRTGSASTIDASPSVLVDTWAGSNGAAHDHVQATKGRKQQKRPAWMRLAAVACLLLVATTYWLAPLFDVARYEQAATRFFGHPVRIGSVQPSFWPRPAIALKDVRVASDEGAFHAATIRAAITLELLASRDMVFPLVEIEGATTTADELRALASANSAKATGLALHRVLGRDIKIVDGAWTLEGVKVDAVLDRSVAVRRITIANADESTKVTFTPAPGGVINLEFAATKLKPFGASFTIDQVEGRGSYSANEVVLREFDGRVLGGVIRGQARIRADRVWTMDGTVESRGLDLTQLAPALFNEGIVNAKGRFKTTAATPGELFAATDLDGTFASNRGVFVGADLSRVVRKESGLRGETPFSGMTGAVSLQGSSRLAFTNVRFKSNGISGSALAQGEGVHTLAVQLGGELATPAGLLRGSVDLYGSPSYLTLGRRP